MLNDIGKVFIHPPQYGEPDPPWGWDLYTNWAKKYCDESWTDWFEIYREEVPCPKKQYKDQLRQRGNVSAEMEAGSFGSWF